MPASVTEGLRPLADPPPRPARRGLRSRAWRPADVATITAVLAGAVLRFATIDQQSFSGDESATAKLLRGSVSDLWDGIVDGESTPPLYYVLGRAWASVIGDGEAGLRSLSAVAGVATVVLAVLAARRVMGRTGGAIAAWFLATNPMLVWFSQEARAYSLLALGCTALFLVTLVALEDRRARILRLWTAFAVLALLTHYFAVFVIVPFAIWLIVVRRGDRTVLAAAGGVVVTGAALVPLALAQRSTGRTDWIEGTALHTRILRVPQNFVTGHDAPIQALLSTLAVLGLCVAVGLGLRATWSAGRARASPSPRTDARAVGPTVMAVALGGIAVACVLAAAGLDVVLWRNFIGAFPILVVGVVALSMPVLRSTAPARGVLAVAGLAAAGTVGLVCTAAVVADPLYQRPDWRSAAELARTEPRADVVVLSSGSIRLPLAQYLPGLRRSSAPAAVRTVVVLRLLLDVQGGQRRDRGVVQLPGFVRTATLASPQVEVVRYRRQLAGPVPDRRLRSLAGGSEPAWVGVAAGS